MERVSRFRKALREHWIRLVVGSVVGALVVNYYLVMSLVALEQNHVHYDDYDMARFAQVLIMFGIPSGALIAYSMRTEGAEQ